MFSGHADTFPRLLGDIGGTNARFAMILESGAAITHISTLPCADYSDPIEAANAYLELQGVPAPRNAAMGVATPVTNDKHFRMTNNNWEFDEDQVRRGVGQGLEHLKFVNDFTALALSLPYLEGDDLHQVGGGTAIKGAPIGVIGPGTGLGVSGLIPHGKHYSALGGEGGHATLSVQTPEEWAVMACIMKEFPHVSAERILSGAGLETLYHALASVRGKPSLEIKNADITTRGVSGVDPLCADTLNMFCALLGSQAGNLALTLGAFGGVFIGGGIVPRFGRFFDVSPFRARFEAKGRFSDYLRKIPTSVITAAYPALTGAAAALSQQID